MWLTRWRISHNNKKSSIVFNQQIEVEGVFGDAIYKWRHQFFMFFDPYLVRDIQPPIYFHQSTIFFLNICLLFWKGYSIEKQVNCRGSILLYTGKFIYSSVGIIVYIFFSKFRYQNRGEICIHRSKQGWNLYTKVKTKEIFVNYLSPILMIFLGSKQRVLLYTWVKSHVKFVYCSLKTIVNFVYSK